MRKDGPIKSIADLKGHTVIVNAKGATTDMLLRKMTRNNGVADNEFTEIEADFTNMLAMLEAGKGDAAPVMAQFNHDFQATDHYRTLFTTTDAVGGDDETLFWVAKADFIKTNRAAMVDMLTDHMAAIRWFLDPANRNEALALTHDFTKQSLQSLDYVFTKEDVYRSPDLMPVIPPIQKDIDIAVTMKMLPASIDVSKYVDLSMVDGRPRSASRRSDGQCLYGAASVRRRGSMDERRLRRPRVRFMEDAIRVVFLAWRLEAGSQRRRRARRKKTLIEPQEIPSSSLALPARALTRRARNEERFFMAKLIASSPVRRHLAFAGAALIAASALAGCVAEQPRPAANASSCAARAAAAARRATAAAAERARGVGSGSLELERPRLRVGVRSLYRAAQCRDALGSPVIGRKQRGNWVWVDGSWH